ncbi:hypothetical protein HHL22_15060 [Hymenobacter sp. RP-2-7]|uniref:Uncharacterized protein n=1 Tax=Hymenobacter polaris TaxID=2682546 RepID=A0A7Y0FNF5_9BACT|nr:hypothetical protein [Hymenobacter polaris]NML66526.1 hypothetical protein [Hymenobacter polaris]
MPSPIPPLGPDAQPDAGAPHLRRAVGELPTHEPDASTWDAIAARLTGEQALARALPQLPTYEPAPDTWEHLAARLDQLAAPKPRWRLRPRRRWAAVSLGLAASLLLLLTVGRGWWRQAAAPFSPVVATVPPALPALPPPPAADPLEAEGEQFIDAHCSSLPQVCQSGEFQQLRAQLTALQQQERRLRTQTQQRGANPHLVQQQVQVTIRKATVTRELIHLLIS